MPMVNYTISERGLLLAVDERIREEIAKIKADMEEDDEELVAEFIRRFRTSMECSSCPYQNS